MDPVSRWNTLQDAFEQLLDTDPADRRQRLAQLDLAPDISEELAEMLEAHDGPPLALEEGVPEAAALPERLGPYEVGELLGSGGMGRVFLGRRADGRFDRKVAIKTVSSQFVPETIRQRLEHEQRLHARLEHPNIARLLDAGVADGQPYLVLEYVAGQPISQYLESRRVGLRERLQLFLQCCDAVAFAHNQFVLHRDIKPSNILVTEEGDVRLLDFGIAMHLAGADDAAGDAVSLTRPGEQVMTIRYASPEQIRGETLDVASDLYSLGVVLYELLTGAVPFLEANRYQLGEDIQKKPPPPPRLRANGSVVPRDLQSICLKALEKRPQDRYGSVADLARDVRRYLDHRPVHARRPSLIDRLAGVARRHPVAAPLSALAVAAILAGAGLAYWQAQTASRERDLAQVARVQAEQVTEVLVDLFDSDPFAESRERRDDVTLREFLTRRGEQLDEEDLPPALRARLLRLLSRLFVNQTLLPQAERYAEQAVTISRDLNPQEQARQLPGSLEALALVRFNQARYDEAEALQREALELRRREVEESHPSLIAALNDLSIYVHRQGREDESLELDREVLARQIDHFGPNSLQAAQSYNNLGASLTDRGGETDKLQAVEYLTRALEIRRAELGDDHGNTATTALNLANLLHDLGRLEEADNLFSVAEHSTREALGDKHMRLADVNYGYGFLLRDLERWPQARDRFAAALAIYDERLPQDHPFIADTHFMVGQVLLELEQNAAAREHLLEAASIYRAGGADEESALGVQVFLAQSLLRSKPAEALDLLEQTLQQLRRDFPQSPRIAHAEALIGELR